MCVKKHFKSTLGCAIFALVRPQVSKEVVVTGFITDTDGKVLIVKPGHKDGWIFPGGYVETDESPSQAFLREMRAELGVDIEESVRLLSIDYRGSSDEYIMFIFDGGVFTEEKKASISLPPGLIEFAFVTPQEALKLLRSKSARRLMPTLQARERTGIAYLENQELF